MKHSIFLVYATHKPPVSSGSESAEEVVVYAKLLKGFHIPTPLGNYSPDWAIAFKNESVKHVFFVAETKGSTSSMDSRQIEKDKIECARELFNELYVLAMLNMVLSIVMTALLGFGKKLERLRA